MFNEKTRNDQWQTELIPPDKLGIIENDNAIIDEFAIVWRQATQRLKVSNAIISPLIGDYQERGTIWPPRKG